MENSAYGPFESGLLIVIKICATLSIKRDCNTSKVICGVSDEIFFGFVLNVSKINTVLELLVA